MKFKKQMLGLMLTCGIAVMSLASCSLLVPDSTSSSTPPVVTPVTFEDTGAYYCTTPNGEYTLTIGESNCQWIMGNETLSGTYVYDGETLQFTFTNNEKATATSYGTLLTLQKGSEVYIFYKSVSYTVQFNVGDASTTQQVVNGKTVAAPEDPVLEGYWFVGWYTSDASNAKLYNFATPVTGDLSLTARFVEKVEQQEFKVTLYVDDEVYGVLNTRGGKLYENELPIPKQEGKTFLGWWVGYFDGETKLSYKYEEQTLGQDTALYAVWSNAKPTVSATADSISWTAAGSGLYRVTIKNTEGQTIISTTTPNLSYSFGFASLLAGEYTVEVCDDADPSVVGVTYYRNKMLDKVGYLTVEEEVTATGISRILIFNEVENATKYLITAYCGDSAHSHVQVESTRPIFDFSTCQMKEGGITFQVEAIADGYLSSVSEVYSYEATLDEVTGLAVNDETECASWNAVENAEYYVVEIVDDGNSLGKVQTTKTEVSLRGLTGSLEVKVYPYARAFCSSAMQSITYQNARLATPTNLKLSGSELVWDAVANATYVVKIDSNEYSATSNKFTLSETYFAGVGTTISISVKAVPTGTDTESRYSDVFTVRLDNAMDASTLSYNQGAVSWGAVFGASQYGVRVNYGHDNYSNEILVDGSLTSCPLTFTGAGAVTIEVRSYVKDNVSAWAASEPVNVYKITFEALGGVEVAPYYKANGDPIAEWPKTTYNGYTFEGWYDIPNALENNGVKQESAIFQGESNVMLFAGYTPNTYKVTYSLDSNAVLDKTEAEVVYYKHYQLDVPTSKDSAKVFAGWYTEPNARGIQYTDMNGQSRMVWTTANNSVVLYPAWYTVLTFTELTENGETTYAVSKTDDTTYVEYLTIPAEYNGVKVTTIDAAAFDKCSNLKEIKIPDTVTFIYLSSDNQTLTNSAFVGCPNLEKITIYCANGEAACNHEVRYESDEAGALLYNNPVTSKKEVKYLPEGFKGNEYEIPYGVEVIPTSAFYGKDLKKIVIPASVIQIDSSAFAGCTELKELIFLEALPGTEEQTLALSNYIFEGCSSLKSLNLPKRVANFDALIFPNEEEDKNAKSIFGNWMTDINITGNAVPGADVYETYYSLDGVLFCGQTLIYAPRAKTGAYRIPQQGDADLVITTIGAKAFKTCTALTSVSIPEWITLIKESAFEGCGMTSLTFEATDEDVDYGTTLDIEDRAFYGNILYVNGQQELILPVNLNKLGKNAIYHWGDNTYSTITVLGDGANFAEGAFIGQDGTAIVHTINLGKNVQNIAISGVFGTNNVHEVNVDKDNPYMVSYDGVIYNKEETEIIYFPYGKTGSFEIRDTVTKLASKLFAGTEITSVTIPASVTEIDSYAFAKCQKLQTVTWVDGDQALTIGEGAFAGATALVDFYIPARVSNIGKGAFANCSFTSLEIKDGSKELKIDDYAFKNVPFESSGVELRFDYVEGQQYGSTILRASNGKLTSITLPTRLRTIGTEAFYHAFNVSVEASIVIPEGVTTIRNRAFANNSGLTSISLPSTLTKMGAYNTDNELTSMLVFDGCKGLRTVTIADGNTVFTVINGVLYGVTDDVVTDLYMSPAANSGDANGNVDIPSTITKIWDNAFKSNTGIRSITFSNGVDNVPVLGVDLFNGCSALESIQLPEGLDKISTGMLSNCNSLISVSIPSTVATIELEAFKSCANLESITFAPTPDNQEAVALTLADGVTTQGVGNQIVITSIFTGCSKLRVIQLPERTEYIGKYAFYMLSLETIAIPSTVTEIGEQAFYKCTKLTEVTFNGTSQLGALPRYAFRDCSALTTINIPASVKEISELAFSGCTSLSTVTLNEGLVTIGTSAFVGTALNAITIPATVTEISSYAFEKCKKLATVTLNEGLETIGDFAFADCKLLEIKIPASVETIGESAFLCCESLANVEFAARTADLEIGDSAFSSSGVTNFAFPEIEDSEDSESTAKITLGEAMFEGCALKTVYLSATITSIEGLFEGATVEAITVSEDSENFSTVEGQKVLFNKTGNAISIAYGEFVGALDLSNVVAEGKELTQIGKDAFKNQTKLTSVIIPTTVQKIDASAFYGCTALTTVTFAKESGVDSALDEIGASAFEGCTALTEVVLPENVTKLGDKAFYNCTAITNIELNANLETVGTKVFTGATALETLTIPEGVKVIGDYMFARAGATAGTLTTIIVPSTVTSIGEGAFGGTESISSSTPSGSTVYVPASRIILTDTAENPSQLTTIGKGAFNNCKNLISIEIPDGVTSIGTHMFAYCERLQSVTLPENITTIGQYMFYYCKAMTSFTIPAKITTIDVGAFNNCSSLTSITIPASVTTIGNQAFRYTTGLRSVTFAEPEAGVTKHDVTLGTNVFELATSETTEFTVTFSSQIKTIGAGAFLNRGITSIEIPEQVTTLGGTSGSGVFQGCVLLTEATLGGSALTQMGLNLFSGCSLLNTVTFREGTTFIGVGTGKDTTSAKLFNGCTSETFTLNIPSTVKTISKLAFCTSGSSSASATTTGLNITGINLTNITQIGEAAFAGCAKLSDVTWGSKLTNIGKQAFYGCTALTSATPTAATTIGQGAFQNCTGLTTADISKISASSTNTTIFSGCTALTSVALNDSLTTIAGNMFENCTSLTSFTLPSKTKTINASAFKGCTALTGISNLSQVTKILSSAFENCTSLTSADISNATEANIKSSTKMFSGCTSLATVKLNSALATIPGQMFQNCTSLTGISIPSTVTYIGGNAFAGSGLTSIDLSATRITNFAYSATAKTADSNGAQFMDCVNLTEVKLPSTTTYICKNVFKGCTSLTTVNWADLTNLQLIGVDAFGDTAITSVTVPASLVTLHPYAFYGTELSTISVAEGANFKLMDKGLYDADDLLVAYPFAQVGEDGVLTLPEGCKGILPSTTSSYYGSVFSGVDKVKTVIIPSSMTSIGKYAFLNCVGLESITIPTTVTVIGTQAFKGCTSLSNVIFDDSETAEELTFESGYSYFGGCSSLTSVNIPGRIKNIPNNLFGYTSTTESTYAYNLAEVTIEEGVETIGTSAFANLPITSITLPSTLTKIGDNAFKGAQLSSLIIPENVTSIGSGAFTGTLMTSVTITAQNITWGSAFKDCTYLEEVTIEDGVTKIPDSMFFGCTALTTVNIADSVTSIGSSAFQDCTALVSIDLPDSLVDIGVSAFKGCTALESIVIPDGVTNLAGSSVTTRAKAIGSGTQANIFAGCTSLASVQLPANLEWIGMYAFQNCTALTSIDIPATVNAIGNSAFAGTGITSIEIKNPDITFYCSFQDMSALETVILPEGLTGLGYKLFLNCVSLKNINIPSTVTTFDTVYVADTGVTITSSGSTFSGCIALESIVIPEGVTVIPANAFDAGSNSSAPKMGLKSITLPSTLVEICQAAFRGCSSLTSIVISRETIVSNTYTFDHWTAEQTIYICATENFVEINWNKSWTSTSNKAKIVYNYRAPEAE